jgi:hypothetical protein
MQRHTQSDKRIKRQQAFGKDTHKTSFGKVGNKASSFWETRQETRHVKKTIKNISKRDKQGWLLFFLRNDTRLQYNLVLLVLH